MLNDFRKPILIKIYIAVDQAIKFILFMTEVVQHDERDVFFSMAS